MAKNKSFANWLETEEPTLKSRYSDQIRAAEIRYDQSRPRGGLNAEKLSAKGLLGSGYADYLAGEAYAARQTARSDALRSLRDSATRGYAAYLTAKEKERGNVMSSALTKILTEGVRDEESAYSLALGYGLDRADARDVARTALSVHRATPDSLMSTVLNRIVSLGLREEYGKQYALACGLSEEEAERVAKAAQTAYVQQKMGDTYYGYQAKYDRENQ